MSVVPRPTRHPARRAVRCLVTLSFVASAASGCTSEGDPATPSGGPLAPSASAPDESFAVKTQVTRVSGELSKAQRGRIVRDVRGLVRGYVEGAFLAEGDQSAKRTFPGFTDGARKLAADQAKVLTAKGWSGTPTVRSASAYLSVLAPRGRAAGATARIRLDFTTADDDKVALAGRLLLTRGADGWQVFGFDIAEVKP